jgi:hypothetical protein
MKKAVVLMLLGGIGAWAVLASSASALPPFKKAWEDKYGSNYTDLAGSEKAVGGGCNVCHVKGADKKQRNDYGKILAKYTGGKAAATLKADKSKLPEILKTLGEGFEKAEGEKSAAGQTYGDLIKAGKLPVTP